MPDQRSEDAQYPLTPEGDYRKAADTLRAAIDAHTTHNKKTPYARVLADMAIRMTAAQNGAGVAAVEPPPDEQGAPQ